jgi:hypothetical protein
LPYESVNGKMFVYVVLAGKKHKFLFDTGSPVAISKGLAVGLGVAVIHTVMLTDAFGGKDSVLVVALDTIQLGGLIFNHIPALEGLPNICKCWPDVEGVLGSNLLRNSIVYINPVGRVMVVTDQADKLPLENKEFIPLITNIGIQSDPKIKIRFGRESDGLFGFDTGDAGLLRFPEAYMEQLRRSRVYDIVWKGYGAHDFGHTGADGNADKYLLKFPALIVDNALFENVIVETNKNTLPAIGARLLDYGSVALDFLHGRFYFIPTNGINNLNEKLWPLQPSVKGDQLVVGVVWGNRLPQLKPGQQILAINDISFEHVSFCDILTKQPILAGMETATITIKDEQGNIKKVQITKE